MILEVLPVSGKQKLNNLCCRTISELAGTVFGSVGGTSVIVAFGLFIFRKFFRKRNLLQFRPEIYALSYNDQFDNHAFCAQSNINPFDPVAIDPVPINFPDNDINDTNEPNGNRTTNSQSDESFTNTEPNGNSANETINNEESFVSMPDESFLSIDGDQAASNEIVLRINRNDLDLLNQ